MATNFKKRPAATLSILWQKRGPQKNWDVARWTTIFGAVSVVITARSNTRVQTCFLFFKNGALCWPMLSLFLGRRQSPEALNIMLLYGFWTSDFHGLRLVFSCSGFLRSAAGRQRRLNYAEDIIVQAEKKVVNSPWFPRLFLRTPLKTLFTNSMLLSSKTRWPSYPTRPPL